MLRKLSLYLSLAFTLLFCTVGIRAYAADDGVVINENKNEVTMSLYKFKSGEMPQSYVERVVKGNADTSVTYTPYNDRVEAECVKQVGNYKYIVTFVFRFYEGATYNESKQMTSTKAFQSGKAYSCRTVVTTVKKSGSIEFPWTETYIIPRNGADCVTTTQSRFEVKKGEDFKYNYSIPAASTSDEGIVINTSGKDIEVTMSLYKFKEGETVLAYIDRLVKGAAEITYRDKGYDVKYVKKSGNVEHTITLKIFICEGKDYFPDFRLEPTKVFKIGKAYTCKITMNGSTKTGDVTNEWNHFYLIPRKGTDCVRLDDDRVYLNGGPFGYSYKLAKSKDQGECTLDLTVGDVEYKSDEEKVIAERIVNALNAAADADRIGSQVKKYTSSGSQVVEMSFDMDRDNKYDFTVTKYDNYYVFSELYALTDSPGWTLKLTGEEKQALDEAGSEYYSTVYIYMYELPSYNIGELSIDFNKGDFTFDLNDTTELAYAEYLYSTLLLASNGGNYGLPEQISLSEQKVSEGYLELFNLNSNDDKYDIAVAIKNDKLIVSQLDTCDCGDEFALELNEKAKKYAENDRDGYFSLLKFKFKKQASETSEQNKQEESAKKQEETQKVEDPVAETEVTLNNATYKIDGENATLSTASTATGNFSIPANVTIGGKSYAVTKIANNAFKGSAIKSLTIGNSITEIGDSAFTGCKNLTKVTIGKNVAKIGKKAFFNCPKLKKVTFKGQKVKKIGSKAFKKIKKGASFKVPKKVLSSYTKLLKGKRDNGSKITK